MDARRDISLVAHGVEGSVLSTPGTLHFMNALVGESATQALRLQNVGIASVTIEALLTDVSGPFSAQAEFPVPRALAPGETLDVDIQFQSPVSGDFVDELEVHVTGEPLLRVRLDGDARLPGSILVDDAIAFGDVYQGSAATYELRIRNAGPGPLSIRSMGITGPNATRFGLSPPSFPSSLTPLTSPDAQNPAFVLSVYYTAPLPITSAEDTATLYLRTDDPANPEVLIPLTGFGIRPVLTPSVTTVNFGEGDVFSGRPTQMLFITNTGVGPLEIMSLATENTSAFVVESNTPLPATLLPNSPPLMVVLDFTPPSPGVHQENLLLTSNDGQNPVVSVALTGAGTVCESLPGATFVQTGPDCAYFCSIGFVDLDENLNLASSNGCEYECTFTNEIDAPDDAFIDANCDGLDGMLDVGIFVDADGGDDDQAAAGSIDTPYATLNAALASAQAGDVLHVAVGTYEESIDLKNGVSIHGGYQPLSGWSRSENALPHLIGGSTAVTAVDIDAATSFTFFSVSADDGSLSGEASIGIYARNTQGLSLRHLDVTAGDGANGEAGENGTAGDAIRRPTGGGNGLNGCESCDVLTGIGGNEGIGCTSASNGGRGGIWRNRRNCRASGSRRRWHWRHGRKRWNTRRRFLPNGMWRSQRRLQRICRRPGNFRNRWLGRYQ
ncbi:MAG: choice-of-anchor D domain-containing protein [Deltaproteobacteria bacterium]|nr:choice-of-anchor D domain-containing protein [Deltaproteobacteria bacterium]